MIKPLFWEDGKLFIVDQTRLPLKYSLVEIKNHVEMAEAIKRLAIRGAPAIGIAAASGMVVGLRSYLNEDTSEFFNKVEEIASFLSNTRPTAVNLTWAIERMKKTAINNKGLPIANLWEKLLQEAKTIHAEDIEMCKGIAENGSQLLPDSANVITHCNAGGLATGGLGTALGVIIIAHKSGKNIHVYVDETRPLLQGARLTTWELIQEKVPFTLCTDSMAGYIMSEKKVDAVIVGADRIAQNGDVANKIGTYGLAVLANFHRIPFYVAAPTSTIDKKTRSGKEIIIEERSDEEIVKVYDKRIAPRNCPVIAPAFDITPSQLITAIITEDTIYHPPFKFSH
jgi:methylthioribose-1-phosphate isomerase